MMFLKKKIRVLHPYFLGVYFILEGFASIADYVSPWAMIAPLGVTFLLVFLINRAVKTVMRDRIKAGVLTFILLVPLLFYARILEEVSDSFLGLGRARFVVLGLALSVFLFSWFVVRTKRKLTLVTAFLNTLTACYIVYGIYLVTVNLGAYDNSWEARLRQREPGMSAATERGAGELPDIYFIILDGYAGSSSLLKYWKYDNTDFTGALEEKGFFVAGESRSLSASTLSSIAADLNLTDDPLLLEQPDEILYRIIRDNRAMAYVRSRGYEIVNLSPFPITGAPRFYRAFGLGDIGPWNFHGLFMRTMVFDLGTIIESNRLYKVNMRVFEELKKTPLRGKGRPRFIYAHVMMPHLPYCFDRDGRLISWLARRQESDKESYLGQLIFTNKKTREMVEALLRDSPKPPVIVIQGDHGFRRIDDPDAELEAVTIFNAVYFPGAGNGALDPAISSIDTLRAVFNRYLGTSLEMLKQ